MEEITEIPVRYKAKHQGNVLWQRSDECTLGISVGQPGHESNKLAATIDWACKRFSKIHVVVSDTLQRHNQAENIANPQVAADLSRRAGDEWIKRNSDILAAASIPLTISRWDDWLSDSRYAGSQELIRSLYNTHSDLRAAVESDARRYLERLNRSGKQADTAVVTVARCTTLILEECAVFCLIWQDHPGVDIYPGSELETMRFLKSHPELNAPDILVNRKFARLLFRRMRG